MTTLDYKSLLWLFLLIIAGTAFGCRGDTTSDVEANHEEGLRIHYVVQGAGEPVVLVHGFSQTHKSWFDVPLYHALLEDYQVILVDLLGHGDSSKPHDPAAYGQRVGADLIDVLDRLELDRAHFVGYSFGASVIGGLLVSHPERVASAVMGSGFFQQWREEEEEYAQWTEDRGRRGEYFPWEPENQDFLALAAAIRGTRHAVVEQARIVTVAKPALVVYGSMEVDHMPEPQRHMMRNLPDSITTQVVAGADHDTANAAILSAEFSEVAKRFISSHADQP